MCGISAGQPAGNGLPKRKSGSSCPDCGEYSIAELCRRGGIADGLYYSWSKEFLEAGKKRLAGDTQRQASSNEVKDLRQEARDLKEAVADLTLENRLLKKSMLGDGATTNEIPGF
jgi:transposase